MVCQDLYDLIIIGGGPAGITAGIYAVRQQLKTLLITKTIGGQMTRKAVDIENWPGAEKISGQDLIARFEKHLKTFGRRMSKCFGIEMDEVVKIIQNQGLSNFSVLTENKGKFQARAVIIASGADPRPLEVPGEKEFIGKGVSYCTVCDGSLFEGKEAAVVGGGNSGFEAALFLSKFAKKVYILEHGPKPAADKTNQRKAKQTSRIEVIVNAALKEIKGKKFVEEIVYVGTNRVGDVIPNSRRVQGVFVEIGSVPATGFVKGLVDFNERDEIKIDFRTGATKTSGLFAAGDVTEERIKQIVVAAGAGAKAALSAYQYLQGK